MKVRYRKGTKLAKWITNKINSDAITLYPYVFFKEESPPQTLINHENVHVNQIRKLGVFTFYASYAAYYLMFRRKGMSHEKAYESIPFEVEAYQLENKPISID